MKPPRARRFARHDVHFADGDVGRACEHPHDRLRHVVGFEPRLDVRIQLRPGAGKPLHLVVDRCRYQAGHDQRDSDLPRVELEAQRFDELFRKSFAHGIGRELGRRQISRRHRRQLHDVPSGLHAWDQRLDELDSCQRVDFEKPSISADGRGERGLVEAFCRVAHDDIDARIRGGQRFHGSPPPLCFAQIHDASVEPLAPARHQLFQLTGVAPDPNDPRARLEQPRRHCFADAGGHPGDDGHLVFQRRIHNV